MEGTELNGKVIQQSETEFNIVCRAKNGDKEAVEWIWKKYKRIMVGMLGKYCYHLSQGEKESEAVMILLHKLEIFKPEKVRKSPDVWSFSYMLTSGMFHQRDKLMRAFKNECDMFKNYDENVLTVNTAVNGCVAEAFDFDKDKYTEFNPEKIVVEKLSESPEMKAARLIKQLSPFQRSILKLRQAGLTIQQIADQMGCGFTRVRLQVKEAKQIASAVFELSF